MKHYTDNCVARINIIQIVQRKLNEEKCMGRVEHPKRHRFGNASCRFYRLDASLSSSRIPARVKLHQDCENRIRCNLIFADLLLVVETGYIKLVDKNACQSYHFFFVETPRKFIIAKLLIRKLGSSPVLIIKYLQYLHQAC